MNAALKAHRDAASAAEGVGCDSEEVDELLVQSQELSQSIQDQIQGIEQCLDGVPDGAGSCIAKSRCDARVALAALESQLETFTTGQTREADVDGARTDLEQIRTVLHAFNSLLEGGSQR